TVAMTNKIEPQGRVKTGQLFNITGPNYNEAQHKISYPPTNNVTSESGKWALISTFPPNASTQDSSVLNLTSVRVSEREIADCLTPIVCATSTCWRPYNSRSVFNVRES